MGQSVGGYENDLSRELWGKLVFVFCPVFSVSCAITFFVLNMTLIQPLSGLFHLFCYIVPAVVVSLCLFYLFIKRSPFNGFIFLGSGFIASLLGIAVTAVVVTTMWGFGLLFWNVTKRMDWYYENIVTGIFNDGKSFMRLFAVVDQGGHVYFTLLIAFLLPAIDTLIKFLGVLLCLV